MKNIAKILMLTLCLGIVWPGEVQAHPVVFCSPSISAPLIKAVDCSTVKAQKTVKIDTKNTSVSKTQKVLRRSATSKTPSPGGLTDSIRDLFQKVARMLDLNPRLLEAVARAESGGNQAVVSNAGAIGVMQLMPGTARGLGLDPYDTEQNILGGGMYLKMQLDRYRSVPLALAAYNAGPGAVQKYGGVPPYEETQRYIKNVVSMMGGD